MEENNKLMSIIKVSTPDLSSELIQEVLKGVRKQGDLSDNKGLWNDVTHSLWCHLQKGLNKFDDQLLCATCFYTVLGLSDNIITYINEILAIIKEEKDLRDKTLKNNAKTLQAVSLMYGMFQSTFLTQDFTRINELADLLKTVFETVFELLMLMAYEYSKYTYIVFKIISSFKKTCGTDLQDMLLYKENIIKLLNVVNHNWENPITGVRDLNKSIFQNLISIMDDELYDEVLKEINAFYWNKAKYLMLAEVINHSNKDVTKLTGKDWIDGVVSSLHKPGLVSAGTDMYFALFKRINSEKEWCNIFMKPIIDLLCGVSQKGIENFSNYWSLTTFKSYPALAEVLLKELENQNHENVYSSICIIKQANKLGFLINNWDTTVNNYVEKITLDGLEHNNNQIRMMAFDVVCVSYCKSLPTKTEYDHVFNFLHNNVNSDCTVLRISMLKSFTSFLTRIHMSFLNYLKDDNEAEDLKYFCKKFQEFLIKYIMITGNYQRKISCIKLAQLFLNGLQEVPKKKQKQTRKPNKNIIETLKSEGHWAMSEENVTLSLLKLLKDPAEDVRDNVGKLLLEHYFAELKKKDVMDMLTEDALKSLSSKFFYEINCGQSMFKLLINILIQEKQTETKFTSVDDVFNFAFKELIAEYELKRGIVDSIEKGKQLHSFLSILHVILEVCHQKQHNIYISNENVNKLLGTLEGISNQFDWDQETSTSSDFSKMSDMVDNIIVISGYNQNMENDQTKISGLHQVVLNCLWLNVKTSCELSSLLIKYQKDDTQIELCKKTLGIISHVLETCRHKGAIEAAGAALGQSILHLTSLPENTEVSKLPLRFLKIKLHEMISEAVRMASTTRRGAGLSIMVHRVVSSDSKRGKPLFHYFVNTILQACKNVEDMPSMKYAPNIDNEKDLPKAIYIHFLTRIVMDSSLASDMMFYSAELAELAFGNLTSPFWQIRNAALQLYGALIQKLIGQKKASGAEEESTATVACDELRTHSPKLWDYIMNQLQEENCVDKVQDHSNLVPILNMLANTARRYNFSSDTIKHQKIHNEMLDNLMLLLDSPIYTVRRLSALCIFNIFNFEEFYIKLVNKDLLSENYIHGSLMLIGNVHHLLGSEDFHKSKFSKLNRKYADILNRKYADILNISAHSYLSKQIFEDIFLHEKVTAENVHQTLVELSANNRSPGVFLWASKRLEKSLQSAPWEIIPQLLTIILSQNERETHLHILLEKIDNENNIPQIIILDVANILLLFKDKFNSYIIWKILYKILLKIDQPWEKLKSLDFSEMYNYLEKTEVSYKLRYMILFATRLSVIGVEQCKLPIISKIIERMINPDTTDVEMRCIAAIANNEVGSEMKNIPEAVKITVIKSAVILLQDEDEDVRMISAKFYPLSTKLKKSLQSYVCLRKIVNHTFLSTILSESSICILAKELTEYLTKVSSKSIDKYNPFANDSSNIYLEVSIFRESIENL